MLLTPAEVASRLAVSRTWVYAAAKEGRIPSVRIGGPDGPLRFIAEDLEDWLVRARAVPAPGGADPFAANVPAARSETAGER